MVGTLTDVADIPVSEFVEHPDEVLRRVEAGEQITVTADGRPVVDIVPHVRAPHSRRSVGWHEFWSWPKTDRGMLDVLREIRADSTDDWTDPWEHYGAGR